MKKFIYATLAIASLLLFASCNKDKNQPKSEEMADAFISFTFNLPQGGGFRAEASDVTGANAQDTYIGTAAEQAINEVRVVLYDPASGEAKYSLDYAISSDGAAAPVGDVTTGATVAKFTTTAKQVVSQEYQMLAIINPTAKAKTATAAGKYLSDAKGAIETSAAELSGRGIMMSNDRGLVTVKTTDLKEDASTAEGAPIAVSVDRILAKIFVGGTPLVTGGTFTNMTWGLNTTNKKTFIYRQFGKVITTMDTFIDETAEDASTRFNRYAKDPNFLASEFATSDFSYIQGAPTLTNTFGFEDANGEYCLENTMDASEQKVNRTTSFILSGTWTPANHDGITFTEGETWYSYMGFTFTKAKMLEYKGIVEDTNQDSNLEINGTPAGFKVALKAALGEMAIDVNGDIAQSGIYQNIKAYKNGACYYQKNLIRHFNNTQSSKDMGYGRYGVVRNNIYKITISKISQPGEPTVIEEGEEDDDPTKVWVAFDITVNPWLVRTQEISL